MGPEYDGPGHRAAQDVMLTHLERAGLRLSTSDDPANLAGVVRDNRHQVVMPPPVAPPGTPATTQENRPDLSYLGRDGRRVNVEVDSTEAGSLAHQRELIRQDPDSRHVF